MIARRAALVAFAVTFLSAQPAKAQDSASSCAPHDLAALASWNGVWAAEGMEAGLSGREGNPSYDLVGFEAPWNDEGWMRMAAVLRLSASDRFKNSGWGFPMMMHSFAELKFIIAPEETAIIGQYREIRYVYTNGKGHPPAEELWPTSWGDSTGCWEGDTLVIDTIGVQYDASFNAFSPPLSEQAHFVERLRMVAPGRIEGEMTVTDPVYLTRPWTAHYVLVPAGIERLVHDAFNDRSDMTGGALTIAPEPEDPLASVQLPPMVKLSVPELDRVVGHYAFEGAPLELIVERRDERLYYKVPPALTFFLPMFAESPLSFSGPVGETYRFTVDEAGQVTGFAGRDAQGQPVKGTRSAP